MKKYIAMTLVLVLTLSMAGCFGGGNDDTQPTETIPMPSTNYTTEPTTRPTMPAQTAPTNPSTQESTPAESGMNGEDGGAQGENSTNGSTGEGTATGRNGNGGM